ncbi:hypothetical protein OAO01_02015 [Oligoflexia bacterium]|nr:hypothetical protein [Oligoflexia bacterium]
MKALYLPILCLLLFSASCDNLQAPDGQIVIKNNILDKKYNVISIRSTGAKSVRASIKPGEHKVLPKGVREIRFSIKYADHSKVYLIQCPRVLKEGAIIKLIDVHSNRIGGGCKLVKRGRTTVGSYVRWEKVG